MPCTAVLALILVASLPVSSAVTPGLRGSKTEGSAAHTDALRPDDVTPGLFFVRGSKTEGSAAHTAALSPDDVNCTDMDIVVQNLRKLKDLASEFVKLMKDASEDPAGYASAKEAATPVANSILANVFKLWQETAALRGKFDLCPDIKKALQKIIDSIQQLEGQIVEYVREDAPGEGSAAHTDALSPDDVNCTDMGIAVQNFRKWKSRANEFVKIMPYVRQDAADDDAATRVANSILENVVKLRQETAALIAKFDQCPAIKKALAIKKFLELNIDGIHKLWLDIHLKKAHWAKP